MSRQHMWDDIHKLIEIGEPGMRAAGYVPVAVLLIRPDDGSGDTTSMFWPGDFPKEQRATLLREMLKAYENNEISRFSKTAPRL